MATSNTEYSRKDDFLRFSAYSFKDLITRKLTSDTNFTDQVYEGSNLAILIDLCSYLFQGLLYCVNNAASESMFSDTQLYKNISRLVKVIGYNPKGFIPSSCKFSFDSNGQDEMIIPRYTAIDIGKQDSTGKTIYYSFIEDYKVGLGMNTVTLYNGRWKLYDTIFTASGTNYETFVLNGIKSDSANQKYDAYGYIEVYVKRNDTFIKFQGLTDEIFLNLQSKYSQSTDAITIYKNSDEDKYYSIRLNENKEYEIKFGNDNNGQKLQKDDQVYVFYMTSNGFDAKINIGEIVGKQMIEPSTFIGIDEELFYKRLIVDDESQEITDDDIVRTKEFIGSINSCSNITTATTAKSEEGVEDIREIAPDFYKLGNRLVSKSDFEYYVKNRFTDIIDAKCQNNWDYISSFYGWLYKLGKNGIRTQYAIKSGLKGEKTKRESNPNYYISYGKLIKYDYYYADPADENNVYIWVKMENSLDDLKDKDALTQSLNSIKLMTAEVVFIDPIDVVFSICAAPVERALQYLTEDVDFDKSNESYLEVTINDNALYSNASVKLQINAVFNKHFKQTDLKLGQVISSNKIETEIYNIPGVERVRTVFSSNELDEDGNKKYTDRFIDGVSLASWSSKLVDIGDDLVVSTTNRTLEDFQFPRLYSGSIVNKIKVIKKSFSNNSTVQY